MGESPQISNLQTELKYLDSFKCYSFKFTDWGVPPGWGWGGCGVKWGFGDDVGMTGMTWGWWGRHGDDGEDTTILINMLAAICNFLHVCACMCTCVGTPPHATRPPIHLPPPQSHREPKTPKFNKSWTNQDNLILFEDSLPLNTPELI